MMKKLFAVVLTLLLAASWGALAEAAPEMGEGAYLTAREIESYLAGSAEVLLDQPGQADFRGLQVGDNVAQVLAAYPNDNPSLDGTYYEATLYIAGEQPEVSLGIVVRDGQHILGVSHAVLSWQEEGVLLSQIVYTIEDDFVTAILANASQELLTEEEAASFVAESAQMQEISEYFAYPVSEDGTALAPLEREDLSVRFQASGKKLDVIDLTYEQMADALGDAPVDEWTEDSNGEQLRTVQWDGVSLLLVYDAQKNFLRVDSLTVNTDVAEGPRGVRVGDFLDSVIFRFQHEEEYVDDSRVLLYGDGQQAPYGVLEYTPESAEVTYGVALAEDGAALWHLTFTAGRLQSMSLLLR